MGQGTSAKYLPKRPCNLDPGTLESSYGAKKKNPAGLPKWLPDGVLPMYQDFGGSIRLGAHSHPQS